MNATYNYGAVSRLWQVTFSASYGITFCISLTNFVAPMLILCNCKLRNPNSFLIIQLCLAGAILNCTIPFLKEAQLMGNLLSTRSELAQLLLKECAKQAVLLFETVIATNRYFTVHNPTSSCAKFLMLRTYRQTFIAAALIWLLALISIMPTTWAAVQHAIVTETFATDQSTQVSEMEKLA